ncbi:MAG: GNAT family N-acetyltransferase [Bacteroidota bacterium]
MPPRVAFVSAEATRPLRHLVLRAGQSFETTRYAEDHEPGVAHVAVFVDEGPMPDGIVTIASGFPEPVRALPEGTALTAIPEVDRVSAYRLRGMATHPDYRGHGLGRLAFEVIRQYAADAGAGVLWFNARTGAQAFYERLGCHVASPVFDIEGIGPHVVMWCETGDAGRRDATHG